MIDIKAPPPDPTLIPQSDLLDVTVILLTCSYKEQEFIRIGYYVNNEYAEEIPQDGQNENYEIDPQKITRNILADKPRVTRFNIKWDNDDNKEDKENYNQQNDPQNDDEQKDNDDDTEEYEDEDEEDEEEEEEEEEDGDELDEIDIIDEDEENNNNNNNDNNDDDDEDEDIDMT